MTESTDIRKIFYLSDRTGITAETFGHTLLTQFAALQFEHHTLPYIDTKEKALRAVDMINQEARDHGIRPIVFSTLVDPDIKDTVSLCDALVIDFFDAFIEPLEIELETVSSRTAGLSHGIRNDDHYLERIDALNYTLANDDGVSIKNYPTAETILIGASRSGKTPTSLYLALHFGIRTANYPLAGNDLQSERLPDILRPYKEKIYGLTINPERLHQIREQRRPDSEYASLNQCKKEVRAIETIYQHEGIPFSDTSQMSIEEITTTIMHQMNIKRRKKH